MHFFYKILKVLLILTCVNFVLKKCKFFFFIGIWTFKLFSLNTVEIARINFPVFSKQLIDSNDLIKFERYVNIFYKTVDSCFYYIDKNVNHLNLKVMRLCENTYWSTRFPDLKSEIRYGFNESLAFLQ